MWIILIGFGMIALTVAIHTMGSSLWFEFTSRRLMKLGPQNKLPPLFQILSTTAVVLLSLHLFEALLWALLYMQLPDQGGLANLDEALYFSMVTFTSLGYGDITMSEGWRSLAGMEAMVGIVVFGLTAAMLFAIIQRAWQYQHSKN